MSRNPWKPETLAKRLPHPKDDIGPGDPALGGKVPRCGACGLPDAPNHRLRLLVGVWGGTPGIRFPLCSKCVSDVNGPQPEDSDPLTVAA